MSTGTPQDQQQPAAPTAPVSPATIKEQAKSEIAKLLGPSGAAVVGIGTLIWTFAQPVFNKHVEVMDALKSNEPQQTRTLEKISDTQQKLAETQAQQAQIMASDREDRKELRGDIRDIHRKVEDIHRKVNEAVQADSGQPGQEVEQLP